MTSDNSDENNALIKSEMEISDYEVIPHLFHDRKSEILKLLIEEKMNLSEIGEIVNLNPGTVRRYLDELMRFDLIKVIETRKNKYGQIMKYYRAAAKKYEIKIRFSWP